MQNPDVIPHPEQVPDKDLSAYIDLLLSQEEYHRDKLLRIKKLRRQAEVLAPDSLRDQINDILRECLS